MKELWWNARGLFCVREETDVTAQGVKNIWFFQAVDPKEHGLIFPYPLTWNSDLLHSCMGGQCHRVQHCHQILGEDLAAYHGDSSFCGCDVQNVARKEARNCRPWHGGYHFFGMLAMWLADGYIQGACAKGQQWQWSLQLLQEMALQNVQDTKWWVVDVISVEERRCQQQMVQIWKDQNMEFTVILGNKEVDIYNLWYIDHITPRPLYQNALRTACLHPCSLLQLQNWIQLKSN